MVPDMRNIVLISIVLMILVTSIFLTSKNTYAVSEVVFIVNTSVETKSLSKSDIKEIFLGEKITWDNGNEIVIAVIDDSTIHELFTRTYLKKSAVQFLRYWRNQVFCGKGSLPKYLKSEKEMLQFVADTKNALGYISSETSAEGVKVMNIIEKE